MAMKYLAASGGFLLLIVHKRLPSTEAVLKGVAMPQGSGGSQLQAHHYHSDILTLTHNISGAVNSAAAACALTTEHCGL